MPFGIFVDLFNSKLFKLLKYVKEDLEEAEEEGRRRGGLRYECQGGRAYGAQRRVLPPCRPRGFRRTRTCARARTRACGGREAEEEEEGQEGESCPCRRAV